MSTAPPPKPGTSTFTKILAGCGCGCLVLLTAMGVGCALFYKSVVGPFSGMMQDVQQAESDSAAARRTLEALDAQFPSGVGEDVAAADITAEQLDRYLRVRATLLPLLAATESALDPLTEGVSGVMPAKPGDAPRMGDVLGMMSGMVQGSSASAQAQAALAKAAADALTSEGMGPTELLRMAELVEWRFLQRPEATLFGLPEWKRGEYVQATFQIRMFGGGTGKPGEPLPASVDPRLVNDATRRLADLAEEARHEIWLSEASAAVVEPRRAELEALGATGIGALAFLKSGSPLGGGRRGFDMRRGSSGASWSTTTTVEGPDGRRTTTTTTVEDAPGDEPAQQGGVQPESESGPTGTDEQ